MTAVFYKAAFFFFLIISRFLILSILFFKGAALVEYQTNVIKRSEADKKTPFLYGTGSLTYRQSGYSLKTPSVSRDARATSLDREAYDD